MAFLGLAGGGGGISASSGADTGGSKAGDIGATSLHFEGINTGTRGAMPAWVVPVTLAFVGVLVIVWAMRRR